MSDNWLDGNEMVYHHTMPKRYGSGMSVKHFRRKLNRHPADATVSGLLGVAGHSVWMFKIKSKHTVAMARDFLKDHEGEAMAVIDFHVTVDLDVQAAKASAGIDAKAPLPAGEVAA